MLFWTNASFGCFPVFIVEGEVHNVQEVSKEISELIFASWGLIVSPLSPFIAERRISHWLPHWNLHYFEMVKGLHTPVDAICLGPGEELASCYVSAQSGFGKLHLLSKPNPFTDSQYNKAIKNPGILWCIAMGVQSTLWIYLHRCVLTGYYRLLANSLPCKPLPSLSEGVFALAGSGSVVYVRICLKADVLALTGSGSVVYALIFC